MKLKQKKSRKGLKKNQSTEWWPNWIKKLNKIQYMGWNRK